jgi:hypothetical protein
VLTTPASAAIRWAHDPDPRYVTRNLVRARQELTAAGASAGFAFELQVTQGSPSRGAVER